jgi:nucleoside-diphosphate-sugar epimerase
MILVTGASGLLGSALIKKLVDNGEQVRAIYRSEIPSIEGGDKVAWVKADIQDILSLEDAMEGIATVYHCAGMVSFNPKNKQQLHKVNVEGTANVVNACLEKGVKKLLYVSSVAALGRIREDQPINETMQWTEETSNSEYGKSKFLGEMEVWRGIGEGLKAVIVNPVIILGEGDWEKGSTEIFKTIYDEFPWYTEGISGFVDVQDVVRAMTDLMHNDVFAQRFIISGVNISYHTLFNKIAAAFNKKAPHKKVTPFIAEVVWRLEAVKGMITGKSPLLTKETARTAQAKVNFDNSKLLKYLPSFSYTPIDETIARVCEHLKKKFIFE